MFLKHPPRQISSPENSRYSMFGFSQLHVLYVLHRNAKQSIPLMKYLTTISPFIKLLIMAAVLLVDFAKLSEMSTDVAYCQ